VLLVSQRHSEGGCFRSKGSWSSRLVTHETQLCVSCPSPPGAQILKLLHFGNPRGGKDTPQMNHSNRDMDGMAGLCCATTHPTPPSPSDTCHLGYLVLCASDRCVHESPCVHPRSIMMPSTGTLLVSRRPDRLDLVYTKDACSACGYLDLITTCVACRPNLAIIAFHPLMRSHKWRGA
jgi:hypothetical protein